MKELVEKPFSQFAQCRSMTGGMKNNLLPWFESEIGFCVAENEGRGAKRGTSLVLKSKE